eukprot:g15842.t1
MESQPPRNHTTRIAAGSRGSDAEEVSDFERDDDDEFEWRTPVYQANSHATGHGTRGASRALLALGQQPPPPQPQPQEGQPSSSPPPPPPPQEQPQQQPQQQPQPPSPLPTFSSTCIAIKKSGKNAGSVCGNRVGTRTPGFCNHHDGLQKRRKVSSPRPQTGGSGATEKPNYESDGDPGGGEDELQTRGAEARLSKQKAAHYREGEKIADPGFAAAYNSASHLKKKPVPKATAGQPAPPAECDDPKGWKLGGLPDDPNSSEFKRRNKHPGGDKFSLGPSLLAYLPKLNVAGLSVARDFIKGKKASLTNTFFQKAFPEEAQDIVLEGDLA